MGARTQATWRSDRGETLVEVLAALVILGIAAVAILAGIGLSVKTSDINRKQATSGAYLRSWAEAIQTHVDAGHYAPCAAAGAYAPGAVGYSVPAGYTASQAAALAVGPAGGTSACSTDTGVQQVTLTLASADARAEERLVVLVRKPCTGSSCTA